MAIVAVSRDRALEALLAQPTSLVAAAVRSGAATVGSVPLTPSLLACVADELELATGAREWTLEHLRDPRPLGEVLELGRLIHAQRQVAPGKLIAAARAATAAPQRHRPLPRGHARGRGASGLT